MNKIQKDLIKKIEGKYKYYYDSGQLAILGNCEDLIPLIEEKSIDVAIPDAPYFEIVKNDWDCQWKTVQDFGKWAGKIGSLIYDCLKDNGSFYWFGDDKNIAYCQVELDKKWRLLNNICWEKKGYQTMKGAESVFRSFAPITERILFYDKGEDKTGLEMLFSKPDLFSSIKKYMREEKEKIKRQNGFTTYKEFKNYINRVIKTSSVSHYFSDSQYLFPTKENYKKLQNTGFFKREYEDLRREYEDLRREYEDLRRCWNNDKKAFDVLKFRTCQEKGRFHPTQKPLDLIMYLLQRVSKKGFLILDPFGGSFTTAIACKRLGLNSIIFDMNEEYFDKSCERLKKECNQIELF